MFSRSRLISLLLIGLAAVFSQGAMALTPADARLTNTASIDFDGNGAPITAEVTVTVQLVTAAPTLVTTPSATANVTSGGQYQVTYEVISNANGNDDYDVTFAQTNNNLSGTTAAGAAPNPVTDLGATAFVVDGTASDTILTVPSDGNSGDSQVNGIAVGDVVRIAGTDYDVTSITDNGPGSPTSTITIDLEGVPTGGLAAGTSVGDPIQEVQSFTVTIANVGTPTGAATIDLTTTVEVDDTPAQNDSFAVTITVLDVTFTKYVRNVTTPANNVGTVDISVNTDGIAGDEDFYSDTGDVLVDPGDRIEYLLVIEAPSGGSPINNVIVSDTLPAFTAYNTGSTQTGLASGSLSSLGDDAGPGGEFPIEPADTENVGNIPAGDTLYVVYQVDVDS